MSISNFINKIKGEINIDKFTFLYLVIIISVSITSFCLGRLSINVEEGNRGSILYNNSKNILDNSNQDKKISTDLEIEKRFVASKNGKMYYSLGCSGAKRIKPENEIWFSTTEEAEKSGYTLSTLCK